MKNRKSSENRYRYRNRYRTRTSLKIVRIDSTVDFVQFPTKTEKSVTGYFFIGTDIGPKITKKYADRFPGQFWTITEKTEITGFLSEPVSEPPITNFTFFQSFIDSKVDFREKTKKFRKPIYRFENFENSPSLIFLDSHISRADKTEVVSWLKFVKQIADKFNFFCFPWKMQPI